MNNLCGANPSRSVHNTISLGFAGGVYGQDGGSTRYQIAFGNAFIREVQLGLCSHTKFPGTYT